jgi:hypothetical protein
LENKKRETIDRERLRKTIISGIQCNYIPMQPGGGDPEDDGINLRAEVWRIITDLDSLKKKCVDDFN